MEEDRTGQHCLLNYSKAATKCCDVGLHRSDEFVWTAFLAGTSFSLTSVVGIIVNLLTVAALAGSKSLRKKPATSFILNVAVADAVYCLVSLPVEATIYFTGYDWSDSGITRGICSFSGLTKHAAAFVDWTSLALIAVERYYKIVVGDEKHRKVFSPRNKRIMIVLVWIVGWTVLGVFAEYGFNQWTRRCTIVPSTASYRFLDRGSVQVAWMALVMAVIIYSSVRIFLKVRSSGATIVTFPTKSAGGREESATDSIALSSDIAVSEDQSAISSSAMTESPSEAPTNSGSEDTPETSANPSGVRMSLNAWRHSKAFLANLPLTIRQSTPGSSHGRNSDALQKTVLKRDLALVKMLLLTIFSYVFLVAPKMILTAVDKCEQQPILRHICYSIYVWLYSINFFIYVKTNASYRKAYLALLRRIFPCIESRQYTE